MTCDPHTRWLAAARRTDAAARRVAEEACEGLGVAHDTAQAYRTALAAEQAARDAWLAAAAQLNAT